MKGHKKHMKNVNEKRKRKKKQNQNKKKKHKNYVKFAETDATEVHEQKLSIK